MAEPFLELRRLSKYFGGNAALREVDLTLARDELLVVLGATGAGKTTLLRTLAGLEQPESGSIFMDGKDALALSPAERDVALVFQNFSLSPDWSARKNLEFPLRAPGRKLSDAAIAERVEWAASLLKITHLLERRATRLSGGEMQRVAIGRAIVRRPKLFLMDEPLTNLDAKLREALRVELVSLRRELGVPMIYVTHDQAEALSMADRIAVLAKGQVLQVGTPEAIYRTPASPEIARQVGQPRINLVPVARGATHWLSRSGEPLRELGAGPARASAILGVRPEHLQLSGGERSGRVDLVENTGPAQIVILEFCGERWHALVEKGVKIRAGDTVHPRFDGGASLIWPDAEGASP
jgi:multiple sugar transport system ATP-binding protein